MIRERLRELAELAPVLRRDMNLELPPSSALGVDWERGAWTNPPIHPSELSAIENALAAPLPEPLRAAIKDLGNGFIGPGRGIRPLSIKHILASAQRLRRRWTIAGPLFPERTRGYEREVRKVGDGALVIAELGRAAVFVVILSGPKRGSIWWDDSADSGIVAPVLRDEHGQVIEPALLDLASPAGMAHAEILARDLDPATFEEWYLAWLDRMLAAVRAQS